MGRFSCCCICTLFTVMAVVTGIFFLILFLAAPNPSNIRMHVEKATLSRFNLTEDNILHYNLSLEVSARNPSKKVSLYYRKVEAQASFDGKWFETVNLPIFNQGRKNTTMIVPQFNGSRFLVLDPKNVDEFNRQKVDGFFKIRVKIYLRVKHRSKLLVTFRGSNKPDGTCNLRLPLAGVGDSGTGFTRTVCFMDYHIPPPSAF